MRIVVAPDKFKGTLTGEEAGRAMAAGARAAHPEAEVIVVRAADGGEGTVDAVLAARDGDLRTVTVRGPLGRVVDASLARVSNECIVVEAAAGCGLELLDEPDALRASSIGAGDLIGHAFGEHPDLPVVVGIGGTASTDGGTGAATAIGWRFLDKEGNELRLGGGALTSLHAIEGDAVDDRVARRTITGACDVVNELTGERGAARVFGPQKGAAPADVDALERGLDRLADVIRRDLSLDVATIPRGGAGGGLGAGLVAFFGARLVGGFEWVASNTRLARTIAGADVVLTGEGRVDRSTGAGKVVAGVAALAHDARARCFVIAGEIHDRAWLPDEVSCAALDERFGSEARTAPAECVRAAAAELLSG